MSEENYEWKGWKIIDAVSKILILLVLGLIAWNQNNFSIELQKAQQHRDTQLKLIEITWNSLIGENEQSKTISLKLLRSLDPDIALSIASAVSQDTTQKIERRQEAAQIAAEFSYSILEGVKIDIYYCKESEIAQDLLKEINQTINSLKLEIKVVQVPKPKGWAEGIGAPRGNEIRYYAQTEDKVAEALAAVLNSSNAVRNFQLSPVGTKTPGTISIVIAAGF